MGVGPHALALLADLASDGALRRGQAVVEIGSQDFVPDAFELTPLFAAFDVPAKAEFEGARELMLHLGFSPYCCIDMDRRHGAIPLDLNEAPASEVGGGQFDVVTNFGTTEHVFDQARCFELIHDLTILGGVMIHVVPSAGPREFDDGGAHGIGYGAHGFYLYTPNFFCDLAAANGYETLRCREETNKYGVSLVVVFRRKTDEPFRKPIQEIYR